MWQPQDNRSLEILLWVEQIPHWDHDVEEKDVTVLCCFLENTIQA